MKTTGRLYKHITGPYYGGYDVIGSKPSPFYPISVRERMNKGEVQPLSNVELDDVIHILVCRDPRRNSPNRVGTSIK